MNNIYLYKNILMNELLNGKSNYCKYTFESSNYMISILNDVVTNNIGLFCLEEQALCRYIQIVSEVSEKISCKNMRKCSSLIKKIMNILNDDNLKEKYKKMFIIYQSKKRKICLNELEFYKFIKKSIICDCEIIPFIVYKEYFISKIDILKNQRIIESSLNYFLSTDQENECYYQKFIEKYYNLYKINLLGRAKNKLLIKKRVYDENISL